MARDLPRDSKILTDDDGEPVGWSAEYGIHKTELLLNPNPDRPLKPVGTLARLVEAARAELAAAGLQTDLEIIEAVKAAAQPNADPTAATQALFIWSTDIAIRGDFLSRQLMAARFLAQWQVLGLGDANVSEASKRKAVYYFADAWHYWHMEVFDEHVKANAGNRSIRGGAKGNTTKRKKAHERDAIIFDVIRSAIDKSAPYLVRNNISRINMALKQAGCTEIDSNSALAKIIQRIKHQRRSGSV